MDDLDRYARERAEAEPAFADGLERESAALRVGVCLQQARQDAGLSQAEVAERLGVKLATVGRMETGAAEIRLATLQQYAELLGQRLVLEVRAARGTAEKLARAARPRMPGLSGPVAREVVRGGGGLDIAVSQTPRLLRRMRSLAAPEWPV
ncbi:helix-turn-helix transcriptional regulator [Longimicrobium sp.]|uniref:helix-turn-helix domain-containing protein n=1 Tax=Longimicrobium sp. TaxID=2029185 RepID=UPI002E3074C2|nr:helix-turn-helix transcriptional regulator [Longimicrobium sp.]HEX6042042.1 helix-turn-helix transcriptional regulator [Longimicrobium sp.]